MDIVEIGFSAQTADLDVAGKKLNSVKAAAGGAETAFNKLAIAAGASNDALRKAAVDQARAAATDAKATYDRLKATEGVAKAEINAAREAMKNTKATLSAARAERDRTIALDSLAAAQKRLGATSNFNNAVSMRGRSDVQSGVNAGFAGSTPALANDQMPNRFNTANIAAQFQDIGVTAAMGMNPMTIALQQGTQLSAIINSMENPLKGIGQAFASIINPVSLMSIGLVGLIAAGIQFVDWISVGSGALNMLADAFEYAAPAAANMAMVLAVIFAPAILTGLYSVTAAIVTMGSAATVAGVKMAAAWAMANPVTAFLLGFAAILTGLYQFRDEMAKALGVDIFEAGKKGVNAIIGAFVGAYKIITDSWDNLPNAMGYLAIEAGNNVIRVWLSTIEKFSAMIDKLPGPDLNLKFDFRPVNEFEKELLQSGETMKQTMENAMTNVDYVGTLGAGIQKAVNGGADAMRKLAENLGKEDDDKKKKKAKGPKTDAEKYEDIISASERRTATLQAEKDALGLTEYASAALRYETEMLNQAQQKNIEISGPQALEIRRIAEGMAALEIETKNTRDAMDFLKDTTRGFYDTMNDSLQKGKSLWSSFGDAVVNVLERIAEKITDSMFDQLFAGSGGNGGGGGFLDIAAGLATSYFTGGAGGGGGLSQSSLNLGGYGSGAYSYAAKGGVFTNSVVDKRTPFSFAGGGAFGEMGEAGPEAIMPLHRGSDGSLGVKMQGAGGSEKPTVNIEIINQSSGEIQTAQETNDSGDIRMIITDIVTEQINKRGTSANIGVKNAARQGVARR